MSASLDRRATVMMLAYGAALWFAAVLLLRAIVPLGALEDGTRAATYALVIPGTVPFVWIARRLTGEAFRSIAIATMTALLLDGVAVGWFPALYGADPLPAAAAILWGAGVGLALGWIMER